MMTLLSERRQQGRLLDQTATGSLRPPRVSIDNNRFTLMIPGVAPIELPFDQKGAYVDVVVVDTNLHNSRLYWGRDENGALRKFVRGMPAAPPECWSDNGIAPSAGAQTPQSPACNTCQWNVIGTAVGFKGGATKACQEFKKLAVVVVGYPGVYLLEIKSGSFKMWNAYRGVLQMQKLPSGSRPDLCDVVTRVRFIGTGLLSFDPIALVENELADQVLDIWEKNEQADVIGMIVGRNDVPAQNVLPPAEQKEAGLRGVPPQKPLPPSVPQSWGAAGPAPNDAAAAAQSPFVLHGGNPAGPLFPQPPQAGSGALQGNPVGLQPGNPEPAPTAKRGRPKKPEAAPTTQPPAPSQGFVSSSPSSAGIQAPTEGLSSDIQNRLRSLFPTGKP